MAGRSHGMANNDKVIKRIIRELETEEFYEKFPKELKAYLYDYYGEDPWPDPFTMEDIHCGIRESALAYIAGKLDVTIKPPLEKAREEIQYLRDLYGDAMRNIQDLESYINELHELLWSNGLEGSRMIHSETGIHEGTYADYNTFDNLL